MPPFRQLPLSKTEPEVKTPSNIDTHQEDAERLFSELPKPLQDRWQEKFDDLYGVEALDFIKNLIQKRELALSTNFNIDLAKLSPELQKEVAESISIIKSSRGVESGFLGRGEAAEVYKLKNAPQICIKYSHTDPNTIDNISFSDEVRVTLKVAESTKYITRIRTPEVLNYYESFDMTCYAMQTINGYDIGRIIGDGEISDEVPMLNPETFKDRLLDFFKTIHQSGYTHNDLHGGNVMLDFSNMDVVVIDFGKSVQKKEIGEDEKFEAAKVKDLNQIEEMYIKYRYYYEGLTNSQ